MVFKSRKMNYSKIIIILILSVFTLSLPVQRKPWYLSMSSIPYSIDFHALISSLYAEENDWGFVRQSAEWARGNGLFIDNIISEIAKNPWLKSPGIKVFENIKFDSGPNLFTIILEINVPQTGITSGAYSGTRTFQNKMEIRRQPQNDLALQLFFDSTEEITDNGALMYYILAKLNPDVPVFDKSEQAIVETFLFKKPDGFRRQVYTWKNVPASQTSITTAGRVVLDEVLDGKTLCFRTVVKVDRTVLQTIAPITSNPIFLNACGNVSSGDYYYILSYMQNFQFPFLTTAKFGWTGDNTRKEGFCGIPSTNKNYGLFNDKGFVKDQVPANQVPSNYPSPNQGEMSVDSAFIATYTSATGLGYSAPGSDDTSKAFIDGISTNANINFK